MYTTPKSHVYQFSLAAKKQDRATSYRPHRKKFLSRARATFRRTYSVSRQRRKRRGALVTHFKKRRSRRLAACARFFQTRRNCMAVLLSGERAKSRTSSFPGLFFPCLLAESLQTCTVNEWIGSCWGNRRWRRRCCKEIFICQLFFKKLKMNAISRLIIIRLPSNFFYATKTKPKISVS